MRSARATLLAAGVAVGGYGAVLLLISLDPIDLIFLVVWLAAVVAVHDGVLVPFVSLVRGAWLHGGQRRPEAATVLAQIGFAVGGMLTLFVIPEVWAQSRGPVNPTILVGDYAGRLLIVWAVIALVVLIVSRLLRRRARS